MSSNTGWYSPDNADEKIRDIFNKPSETISYDFKKKSRTRPSTSAIKEALKVLKEAKKDCMKSHSKKRKSCKPKRRSCGPRSPYQKFVQSLSMSKAEKYYRDSSNRSDLQFEKGKKSGEMSFLKVAAAMWRDHRDDRAPCDALKALSSKRRKRRSCSGSKKRKYKKRSSSRKRKSPKSKSKCRKRRVGRPRGS